MPSYQKTSPDKCSVTATTATIPLTASLRRPPGIIRPAQAGDERTGPGAVAEKLLMKRYSPPCVVVNEKCEVVYVSTRMGRFLELPVGEPTRDILKMAREELRPSLRAAIFKAFAEEKEVIFRGGEGGYGRRERDGQCPG